MLEFRHRRSVHRNRAAGQPRAAPEQEDRLGFEEYACRQRPGSCTAHPSRIPQRLADLGLNPASFLAGTDPTSFQPFYFFPGGILFNGIVNARRGHLPGISHSPPERPRFFREIGVLGRYERRFPMKIPAGNLDAADFHRKFTLCNVADIIFLWKSASLRLGRLFSDGNSCRVTSTTSISIGNSCCVSLTTTISNGN